MKWAVLALLLAGCADPARTPRAPSPGAAHFVVATFNIWDERASDPSTIDAIAALGADVVALQEVTPVAEPVLRARFATRYPHMIFHPSGSAGIGFLSVFPLTERAFIPGPNGWHPALHVTADTPSGPLEILNVHLHAPEGKFIASLRSIAATPREHREEIELFFRACSASPALVLGDFNEDPSGAAVEWLEERGFRNALPLYRPGQFTWQGRSLGGQFQHAIDHVMVAPSLVALDARTASHGASDHLPVIVHLEAHH